MNLLALETSSAVGSVALSSEHGIVERTIATPREQTELMLPLVAELLAGAGLRVSGLDAVVIGRGPGSFTGLRISAAAAQGLALAAGLPVIPVSSLEALAQRAWREHGARRVSTCVDARMGEVYFAAYEVEDGLARLLGDERLAPPSALAAAWAEGGWSAVGSGWARHAAELAPLLSRAVEVLPELVPAARDLLPRAAEDLAAGRVTPPEAALPVYLRDESAWHR